MKDQTYGYKPLTFNLRSALMRKPKTVKSLEELGRVQLSKNFFMREFLYSEISQIESISSIPDDVDLAIASGRELCNQVLEAIQDVLGRISIRSAYRSCEVNAKGAENQNQYNCASNESNYARLWEHVRYLIIRQNKYMEKEKRLLNSQMDFLLMHLMAHIYQKNTEQYIPVNGKLNGFSRKNTTIYRKH